MKGGGKMKKNVGSCNVVKDNGGWYFELSTKIENCVVLVSTAEPFISKQATIQSMENFVKKLNIDEVSIRKIINKGGKGNE